MLAKRTSVLSQVQVVQELIRRSAAQAGYRVRRIIGDLRKCADVAGDRATPEAAERRQHGIVVGMIGIRRRGDVRLRVGEAGNRHHRDRRHPSSLAGRCCGWGVAIAVDAAGIAAQRGIGLLRAVVVRERRRPVEAAARGVAEKLEAAAERRQPGKAGVAGAARLTGLTREARQRPCRRRGVDHEKRDSGNERKCGGNAASAPQSIGTFIPHRVSFRLAARLGANEQHDALAIMQRSRVLTSGVIARRASFPDGPRHFGNERCICNDIVRSDDHSKIRTGPKRATKRSLLARVEGRGRS